MNRELFFIFIGKFTSCFCRMYPLHWKIIKIKSPLMQSPKNFLAQTNIINEFLSTSMRLKPDVNKNKTIVIIMKIVDNTSNVSVTLLTRANWRHNNNHNNNIISSKKKVYDSRRTKQQARKIFETEMDEIFTCVLYAIFSCKMLTRLTVDDAE